MSTKSIIKSAIQKGDKSESAMNSAFDNANEVAASLEREKGDKKAK